MWHYKGMKTMRGNSWALAGIALLVCTLAGCAVPSANAPDNGAKQQANSEKEKELAAMEKAGKRD